MSRSSKVTWRDVRVKSERRQDWQFKCQCGRCTTSRGLRKGTYRANLDDPRDLLDALPSRREARPGPGPGELPTLSEYVDDVDNDVQERVRKDV